MGQEPGWSRATEHLDSLGIDAMKTLSPSLGRINALLDALDRPEKSLQGIHIAGTNGKSSTARIASSLLVAAGLSVGTFTSPHLSSVRERITLNGEPLSEAAFGAVFEQIRPYIDFVEEGLGEKLSYFELLTGMFFLWAAEQPVDVAVVETGLGGTWDATNVFQSDVAVITNIGLDHMQLLGHDRMSIATEKVGIVKPGSVAVIAERLPDIQSFLSERSVDVGAAVSLVGRDFETIEDRVAYGGRYLSLRTHKRDHHGLFLPLHGSHQARNASAALEAVTRLLAAQDLDDELVAAGFEMVRAPGRMETIPVSKAGVPLVLDVAHNPEGMSSLVNSLAEAFPFERVLAVVGFLQDKEHLGMLSELGRLPIQMFLARPDDERGLDPSSYADEARGIDPNVSFFASPVEAIDAALADATSTDLVLVTGSHYVVGAVRDHLVQKVDKRSREDD